MRVLFVLLLVVQRLQPSQSLLTSISQPAGYTAWLLQIICWSSSRVPAAPAGNAPAAWTGRSSKRQSRAWPCGLKSLYWRLEQAKCRLQVHLYVEEAKQAILGCVRNSAAVTADEYCMLYTLLLTHGPSARRWAGSAGAASPQSTPGSGATAAAASPPHRAPAPFPPPALTGV